MRGPGHAVAAAAALSLVSFALLLREPPLPVPSRLPTPTGPSLGAAFHLVQPHRVRPHSDLLRAVPSHSALSVAVLSAYYSRLSGNVSVIAASNAARVAKASGSIRRRHFCAFYADGLLLAVHEAQLRTRYLLSCVFPAPQFPARLFLYSDEGGFRPHDDTPPWTVAIVDEGSERGSGLAVCVKALYGAPDWVVLLQFFEHYLLQGARRLILRARLDELAPHILRLLAHYEAAGVLTLDDWSPVRFAFCPPSERWCQLTQINDCVRGTAGRFAYTAVVDVDELLRPADLDSSLLRLLRSLDGQDRASFTFVARYQLPAAPPEPWPPSGAAVAAPWRTWRNSSGFVSRRYSPKSIVRPELVDRMWVHFPRTLHNGWKPYGVLPDTEGHMVHFKRASEWELIGQTQRWTNFSVSPLSQSDTEYVDLLESRMRLTLQSLLRPNE